MTGFASLTHEDERGTVAVTVRAVNHRFLDLQIRVPPLVSSLEARLRALLQKRLARGRVELGLSVQLRDAGAPTVELNLDLAKALSAALDRAREQGLVVGALAPGDLLRVPQVIAIREHAVEPDALDARVAASVETAVDEALADLDAMRVREGAHLAADLESRRERLGGLIERLCVAAAEGQQALEARLRDRVDELRLEVPVDQAMIAQEIVRLAARSDISEEVTRFRAHLAHWRALSESDEPCGRKLDFLLQEMNREVNTIGSKAELERMREQVQNVE
jgi:uncharacterized protein (TIGR00255 family)